MRAPSKSILAWVVSFALGGGLGLLPNSQEPSRITFLSVGQGDCTLMVCDAKAASRNAAINQLQINRQITQVVEDPFVRQGKPGQTWVEIEQADHQIAAPPPLKSK